MAAKKKTLDAEKQLDKDLSEFLKAGTRYLNALSEEIERAKSNARPEPAEGNPAPFDFSKFR